MAGGNAELIAAMQQGLMGLMGSSSGYIESLPAPVKTRVEYLQELQEKYDEYEQQMHEEIKAIEEKYTKLTGTYLLLKPLCFFLQVGVGWKNNFLLVFF